MKRRDFFKTAGAVALPVISAGQLSSCNSSGSENKPETKNLSKVFMTKDISGKGLMALYKALGKPVSGKVALKLHMGEPGNVNYLRPEIVRDLCMAVNGSFVDCNVYYESPRATSAGNKQAALDHGYTFAPVDILDSEGEVRFPIKGGLRLKEAIFGSHIVNYDWIISIANFKGHSLSGFGGTFKNLAVGIATPAGKRALHTNPGGALWSRRGNSFLEMIVEYNVALLDAKPGRFVHINVLSNLSLDCDCIAGAGPPVMPDIGVLASLDPVALEKASLDLIYARPAEERRHLVERIESRNGIHKLIFAERAGLGSQTYELIRLNPVP